MVKTKTIHVPHLGGIEAAYQMLRGYDPARPTVVMINAFTMLSELYRDQFDNTELPDQINLIAIELLGHGQTRPSKKTLDLLEHGRDESPGIGCTQD